MSIRHYILLLACAGVIVGCKGSSSDASADNSSGTTTGTTAKSDDTTTGGATTGDTAKTDDATKGTADASDNSIVGTWDTPPAKGLKSSTYEFKDDGTAVITVVGDAPDKKGTMTITIDETYKLDNGNITMQPTGMKMDTDEDANKAAVEKSGEDTSEKLKKAPPGTGPVTWTDKDDVSFTLTTPAFEGLKEETKTVTLKRHAE